MAHRRWTSERTTLPGRVQARVRAGRRHILLDTRRLPDPLPGDVWARIVEQAEAYICGDFHAAPHCVPLSTPDLQCLDGGAAAVPRADAG